MTQQEWQRDFGPLSAMVTKVAGPVYSIEVFRDVIRYGKGDGTYLAPWICWRGERAAVKKAKRILLRIERDESRKKNSVRVEL